MNPYAAPGDDPDPNQPPREGGVRPPPSTAPDGLIVIAVLGFLNYVVQIVAVVVMVFLERAAVLGLAFTLPGLVGAIGLYRERRWGLIPFGGLVALLVIAAVFRRELWSGLMIYLLAVPIAMLATGLRYWRVLD